MADRRLISQRALVDITNVFIEHSIPQKSGERPVSVSVSSLRKMRTEVREKALHDVLSRNSHQQLVGIMLDERKDKDPSA